MASEPPSVASILQQQPGQSQNPHASGFDNLTCQWQGCGERCASPEQLYEHVCERHVGRKSTNNLNLQCQWGSCRTTTVKRDHITSHIRVHVPLKPHKCEFCGKSFKRPQDLKKHVKTHADDSVLNRSPDAGGAAVQRGPMPGYPQGGPRDPGMYGAQAPPMPQPGYGYPSNTAAQAPMNGGGGGYGPVYYNIPQTGYAGLALTEQRKRQHDTLDAFFGDIKRRQLDPTHYFDLGAQFGGMEGLPMFADGGYGGGGGGGGGGVATAPMAIPQPHHYDPATFNNIKTRNDLESIDQFLGQLQKTVYEYSNTIAVAGAQRSHEPMHNFGASAVDPTLGGGSPGRETTGTNESVTTPGLTASDLSSRSPGSVHSYHSNVNATTGYPSLPTVGVIPNQYMNNMMHQQASGVAPSGLGNEDERGRRYSGGNLQRAKPASPRSLRNTDSPTSGGDSDGIEKSLNKSPLGSPSQTVSDAMEASAKSGQSDVSETANSQEETMERWVNNMRTIEAIRRYVHGRLQQGDYEDSGSPMSESKEHENGNTTPKAHSPKDYPMEDVKSVAYPTLRSS